jgi:hypothetical protein
MATFVIASRAECSAPVPLLAAREAVDRAAAAPFLADETLFLAARLAVLLLFAAVVLEPPLRLPPLLEPPPLLARVDLPRVGAARDVVRARVPLDPPDLFEDERPRDEALFEDPR